MNKLYGLIFDVDGVIADTEAVNTRATIKVFAEEFGVQDVQQKDFEAGLGRGAEEYIRAATRVHGMELTDEQLAKASSLRQENFLAILELEGLQAYPGVIELIEEGLKRPDFGVAIATSSTREKSEAVLRATKVPYEKMVYISGQDVKRKKPDPELFQVAAEGMGIEPTRCVVIEDAPNGVKAAKAAGSKCIAVTNTTTADKLAEADLVVDSLAKVDMNTIMGIINVNNSRKI
jgi:HAD superfamily hydrolase (TIGR01509 family)